MVQWREISGFPEYHVSDDGRVKRVVKGSKGHPCAVLKTWRGNHQYETVGLWKDGYTHRRLIHRLVCEAFKGPAPTPSHQVAHNDGTRNNNSASNLRWATRSENMRDCVIHGTQARGPTHGRTVSPERTPRGERHGHAKLTENDVWAIKESPKRIGSGRRLAYQYGVSPATISLIRSGKNWKHLPRKDA